MEDKTKNNLPVVKKNILPVQLKNKISKIGKILGLSSSTALLFGTSVISAAVFPPLVIPSAIALLYSTQKLLNQTVYTSHKDIAFITRKVNNNIKIFQDVSKISINHKLMKMSSIDKTAFIQLQAIVGMSKLNEFDKNGNSICFETDTHTVVRKTLKKLANAGFLENYSESNIQHNNKNLSKHLILPKLAFGNIKDLKNKVEMYNVKFQLGNKIDINDSKLKELFPLVFSTKNGLLSKYNYDIIQHSDGSLSIDYNANKPFIDKQQSVFEKKNSFRESLQKGTPTLQKQKDFSKNFNERQQHDILQNRSEEENSIN